MAYGTVHAYGPETEFTLEFPLRPQSVELDPASWILSDETTTKRLK